MNCFMIVTLGEGKKKRINLQYLVAYEMDIVHCKDGARIWLADGQVFQVRESVEDIDREFERIYRLSEESGENE